MAGRSDSFSFSATQQIPNLIQGVSQQAEQQRRDAQCEAQFDCINSVSDGAVARPPAELVRMYPGLNLTGAFFSETFNGDNENYVLAIKTDGSVLAYDLLDGTPCTIILAAPDTSYFSGGSGTAAEKLRGQVVDDYTFVANRTRTTAMESTTTAAKVEEALVFARATQFNCAYTITLNGTLYSYTTDNTVVTATSLIMGELKTLIDATPSSPWTVSRVGSVMRIRRTDGAAFTIETTDGGGDDDLLCFYGRAKSYSKLPNKGFNGMLLAVKGDSRTGADDFYVKFNGPSSTGVWDETVGPNVKTTINAATMPHTIQNTNFREFTVRRPTWSTRIAGDADTAKDPSFIGKKLRDVTYFNRRLGLIHAAGTVFSKTDNPYTFFPDTLQTVLATAPVDLKVSAGAKRGAAVLDFAVLTAESIYLWAQGVQFRVTSNQDPFKQDTVENLPAMAYEYSPNHEPLSLGSFLYMGTDAGDWASLRALQFQQGRFMGDVDVTAHCGQYVPAGVRTLTASETLREIFVHTDGYPGGLILFNYTWDGQQFLQTALNTWRIPGGTILWCSVYNNKLRILQQRPEGVALLSVSLTPGEVDPQAGAEYKTRLDMRVNHTALTSVSYDSVANTTTFTLPYTPTGPALKVVLAADSGSYTRGREFPVLSVVGPVVTVSGNVASDVVFYVGQIISAEREESVFFIRGDQGAEPYDRLTVNRFKLECSKTGYTRLEVSNSVGIVRTEEFPARILGTSSADTGAPNIRTSDMDIGVGELAEDVTIRMINDSWLPSSWQSAAYDFTAVGWKGGK